MMWKTKTGKVYEYDTDTVWAVEASMAGEPFNLLFRLYGAPARVYAQYLSVEVSRTGRKRMVKVDRDGTRTIVAETPST